MKRKLLIVYVFVAFVLLCTNVYAALTMDLSLVPESEKVKQGSDLVIAVKLNNVSAPIASIEGYINVDENVLEPISSDMIKGDTIEVKSNGTKVSSLDYKFNPTSADADYDVIFNTNKSAIENNDCFFIMDLRKNIQGNCDIMTLNFKVKEDATVSQATQAVKFKVSSAVSAADTKDKVTDLSANLSFEVLDKNASTEEPSKPDDNKPDDNKPDDNKPDDNKPDPTPEKKELKGEISYSTTSETTGPVTATLKVDDGVTVTNNSGKKTYTFSKNGYYIFEFADDAGNTGKARAEVNWIKATTGNGNNDSDKKDDNKNENKNINNTNTNNNRNTNTNTNNTNRNANTNKNINDTTVAGSKIPKAGAGMLILPVIVCAVLGYVSYIKYLQYKEIK